MRSKPGLRSMVVAVVMASVAFCQGAGVPAQPYTWKNVKVGAGGFIPAIVFNTKQPGLVYCRTDIGSSYKWDSQTRRWIPLTDWCGDSNLHGTESLATDPVDPNRLYLAQGMYSRDAAAIMRSLDQGKTFQVIPVPFRMGGNEPGRGVGERLAIDPNDNSILYFGSRAAGLWMSKDAALTWTKVESFPTAGTGGRAGTSAATPANTTASASTNPATNVISGAGAGRRGGAGGGRGGGAGLSFVVFDSSTGTRGKATGTIYVGSTDRGDAQLFRSTDAGLSWHAVPGQPTEFVPIHAAFDTQGMLYLVYDNGVGPTGVTDGAVWKLNTKDGTWTNVTPDKNPNRPPGGYGGIGVDLQKPGVVIVATLNRKTDDDDYRIYRTTDGGRNWKDITARTKRDVSAAPYVTWIGKPIGDLNQNPGPSVGWWMASLAIDPFNSDHVCYATGVTIWNCTDIANADADKDTHWSIWTEGIEETAVIDLASPPTGAHLISSFGDISGFTHDDVDASPQIHLRPLFTTGSSLDFAEKNPNIVIRTGSHALHIPDQDTMAYSLDGGHTWAPFSLGQAGGGRRGGAGGQGVGAGPVILSADGSVFMSTAGTVQISTNRGATWTPVQGLPPGVRPVADRANPAKFYALSATDAKLYRSVDRGVTFTPTDVAGVPAASGGGGRGGGGGGGLRLMAVPSREGDLWLVGRGALHHSTDGGASFKPIANPPAFGWLSFGKAAPGKDYPAIFVAVSSGSQPGVFRSDDVGATWVRINDDQNQWGNRYRCIAGDPRIYGRVYVGTDGRGILYGDITSRRSAANTHPDAVTVPSTPLFADQAVQTK